MTEDHSTAMDRAEIDDFLGRGGTGVLSLAKENTPYAIPISYGYDPERNVFYVRLGYTPESEKRAFVEATAAARLVVYDRTNGTWKSVIAVGQVDEIASEDVDADVVTRLREADLPLFEIWDESLADVTFVIARFSIDSISGRIARGDTPV